MPSKIFEEKYKVPPPGRRRRPMTLAEANAKDLHLETNELWEHAQNRRVWESRMCILLLLLFLVVRVDCLGGSNRGS